MIFVSSPTTKMQICPCKPLAGKTSRSTKSHKYAEYCLPFTAVHRNLVRPCCIAFEAATDVLTKDDLVKYLASGCKPKENWRIGTEHEKLGYSVATGRRMTYQDIAALLRKMQERFDWQAVEEAGHIIGLSKDGQSISLEPGGQFELSGAPVATLHHTCSEVNNHLYQCKTIAKELGLYFLGVGFDPLTRYEDCPVMPKARYQLMRSYMPTRGDLGLDMMFRSCTIQVNLDFGSEVDMIEKMRIGLALQPIATALFAASPFKEGKKTGYVSWRSHVWEDTDPDRCGTLPFVWDDYFSFERYVDYALDVPMYFVYRKGRYINALGQSFKDFMKGKLAALPGEVPTLKDWEAHLTTIFPEVRLKRFVEMRGADGGPFWRICSLPALWVGLLYDDVAQRQALELVSDWSPAEREYLRHQVAITGLQTPFRGASVCEVAVRVLEISRQGLVARGRDEVGFLDELLETAESGVTLADKLIKQYDTEWNGDVTNILHTERM